MKIKLSRRTNPNNPIDKRCLEKVESLDALDEEDAEICIYLYNDDEETKLLGNIEGYLLPDKAGLLITRFHNYGFKSNEKDAALREVVDFIFDFNRMGQWILGIYIHILESHIKDESLERLGFCPNSNFFASEYYRKLNPNYISIVSGLVDDPETYKFLITYFNNYVNKVNSIKNKFLNYCDGCDKIMNDPNSTLEIRENRRKRKQFYKEAIEALGSLEKVELEDEKGKRGNK